MRGGTGPAGAGREVLVKQTPEEDRPARHTADADTKLEQQPGHRPENKPEDKQGQQPNWWVLVTVGVGTFMSALDGSVVNTILPVLTRALHSKVTTIEWVVTIYLLVVSGLLLSVGRWGDMYGHKRMYVTGFVLFLIGSMLCGMSPSAHVLIAFRGMQALGAAMMFASSPAILTRNFPARQRGQVLGLQATMTYLGLTAGPLIGGWLATQFSWRWVFYINVPIGVLGTFLAWRFVPNDTRRRAGQRFDVAGAAVFLVGLVSLLLALNQGSEWGWGSPVIVGLIILSVILLAVFLTLELRRPDPMLDLTLFRRRVFSAATASALLNYITIYSVVFVLPFYLIQGRGYTAERAGVLLTAQPLVMAVAAPLSGFASDKIGTRFPATLGMAILTTGVYLLSRLTAASSPHHVMVALAVTGLGTGIFISPNNSALMGSAPRERQGIAAGVLATARNVGMVMGVGIAGAVFTSVLAREQAHSPSLALFDAVDASFIAATIAAAIGTVTSFVRGRPAED